MRGLIDAPEPEGQEERPPRTWKQGEILLFGEILRSLRSLRLTTDLVRAAKPESGKRTRAAPAGTQKDDPA
jgi:hypothetical protein